jgi:DMSO/TMAO reductase YedYZ molybdopterin-dependent catalytic subunit
MGSSPTGVFGQTNFSLKISGEVTRPLQLTLEDIAAMPHKMAVLNDRDGKPRTFSGVPLSAVLSKAGVTMGKELRGGNLSKYLLVKCADGYEVLFSLAELDNSFTNKIIVLADSIGGKPLPKSKGPLRIIVPGEKKPARSCFQVVEMVVGHGKD